MEIIRKKVSLEKFKSRIPALIETITPDNLENKGVDGSWGKIPKPVVLFGQEFKYGTMMNLYYRLLNIIKNASYYEYDASGKKWLDNDYDWRRVFEEDNNVSFYSNTPSESLVDRMRIGLINTEDEDFFYNEPRRFLKDDNTSITGIDIVKQVNEIIGRLIVPTRWYKMNEDDKCDNDDIKDGKCPIDGIYVPYFIYKTDIPDLLSFMDKLKEDSEKICCEKKRYADYGGSTYHKYLKDMYDYGWSITTNPLGSTTTLDIPILITSKITDLGLFKQYNVDEVVIDDKDEATHILDSDTEICKFCGKPIDEEHNHTECKPTIVQTTSESKLRTLRKKRVSVDDLGETLPGIYNPAKNILEFPYQIGYVKNVHVHNGIFYGDTIVDMKETCTPIEVNESQYQAIKTLCSETQYSEGTISKPISGIESRLVNNTFTHGDITYTVDKINEYLKSDLLLQLGNIKNRMYNIFNANYPAVCCMKQDYSFTYELTIGVENDINEEDFSPDIVESAYTETVSGAIYITFDKPKMVFTYVLGGRLTQIDNKLQIDEISPYVLSKDDYPSWDGDGIWYQEAFDLKKMNMITCLINEVEKTFLYDEVNFATKEKTLTFPGIDYPRKNYILCEDVRYKSETYQKHYTTDPVFRDEKMLGLKLPLKEEYNVEINRGMSSAFEKHLQLAEITTWQDLENYRNGSLLNN